MMVGQLWVDTNGDEERWGAFEFLQLPSPGDLIWAVRDSGSYELRVLYLVHVPFEQGKPVINSLTGKPHDPAVKVVATVHRIRES